MKLGRLRSNKGFTLVELMTVVAIIGALAAIGVPQYKKMQRRAKRAEAMMGLGVIASAEASFFAEYNGYGNSMGGIGAEMDLAPQHYNIGFLGAGANHAPAVVQAPGQAAGFRYCESAVGCDQATPRTFTGYQGASIKFPVAATGGSYEQRSTSGFQAMQPQTGVVPAGQPNAGAPLPSWQVLVTAGGNTCANRGGVEMVGGLNTGSASFLAVAAGNLHWNTAATSRWDCITINTQRTIDIQQDGT